MVYKLHMQCCCHASHKSTSTHGLTARAILYNRREIGRFKRSTPNGQDQHAKNRLKSNYFSDFKYTYPPLHHFKYAHPAFLPSVHYHFLGLQHKLCLKCTQSSSIHTKIMITLSSSNSYNNHFTFNSIHNHVAVSSWHLNPNPLSVLFKLNLLTLRKCKQHNLCLVI